jgi:UDP-2,4-diacetamido-2,4,6-trideoxy-beta-L-altropyranose hydrolase
MRVVFRADASVSIGTGHIVRCATLAEALRATSEVANPHDAANSQISAPKPASLSANIDIHFITHAAQGDLNDWLPQKGFTVHILPQGDGNAPVARCELEAVQAILSQWPDGVDWLVVDHYGLDAPWESAMRPFVRKILVIDDLANRAHDCDALLDQNWHPNASQRYQGLVPAQAQFMLGPEYALLRPEFAGARAQVQARRSEPPEAVLRLLICFGGTDPSGETLKALAAVVLLAMPDLQVDVVVGAGNPCNREIEAACQRRRNTTFYCQTEAVAELMGKADVALTSGGTVTWEKLCVGLPGLSVAVAENQLALSEAVQAAGAQWFLGLADGVALSDERAGVDVPVVTVERMREALLTLCADAGVRRRQAERGMLLVDGQGAGRVAGVLARLD